MKTMSKAKSDVMLGTLLCKWCNEIVGELDTEKVTLYYTQCKDGACRAAVDKEGVGHNEQAMADAFL